MIYELLTSCLFDGLFVYQLTATLTTYCAISTVLFFQKRAKRYKLFEYYGIPGPKPRLLDGSLHLFIDYGQPFMIEQSFKDKYGKYYGYFIGDEPSITISDLELLKRVFLEKTSSFKERSTVFLDTTISRSILFTNNARWKSMRKVMSPAFSTYTMRGNSSTEFVEESIRLMLDYIEEKLKLVNSNAGNNASDNTKTATTSESAQIDMHDLMKATALHMISSMAIKLPDVAVREDETYVKSLDSYLSSCDKGPVVFAIRFPFLKRILSFLAKRFHFGTMKVVHQSLNQRIDSSLESLSKGSEGADLRAGEHPQLIDTMIRLHHERRLSRDEVIGNAEAILFAGYDTTSTTLSYIFWVLGKHQQVQDRLRIELMAHGIESKYLDQVINETMRLYPTVISFTTRLATETVAIDEKLTVPQGARVVFNSWLVHRDATIWPEPDKFDPERFRAGVEIHPCAFAPFGLGERRCLGYQLARFQMKMIVCDLLMRYRIGIKSPQQLELVSYAVVLTKPKEKILIELETLRGCGGGGGGDSNTTTTSPDQ